jgi:hypothetical protein
LQGHQTLFDSAPFQDHTLFDSAPLQEKIVHSAKRRVKVLLPRIK